MEPRGGKRWGHERPKRAKTVAAGCERLPFGAHGKKGVERAADGQQTPRAAPHTVRSQPGGPPKNRMNSALACASSCTSRPLNQPVTPAVEARLDSGETALTSPRFRVERSRWS